MSFRYTAAERVEVLRFLAERTVEECAPDPQDEARWHLPPGRPIYESLCRAFPACEAPEGVWRSPFPPATLPEVLYCARAILFSGKPLVAVMDMGMLLDWMAGHLDSAQVQTYNATHGEGLLDRVCPRGGAYDDAMQDTERLSPYLHPDSGLTTLAVPEDAPDPPAKGPYRLR